MTKKTNPLLRAWAAGVYDARMSVPKNGCVLRFDTIDEKLVRRFHEVVGVGQVAVDDKKRTINPVHIYRTVNFDDAHTLIKFVSPFLSPAKMKASAEVLARIERNPNWQKKNKKKAILSETSPAPSVEEEQERLNTATDGRTVSPAI